jgi:hypothetical protein
MAVQGRKKVKAYTIDNRVVPQGNLERVNQTPMPKLKRKRVLSIDKIVPIIELTVFIINKRPITMIWNWLKDRLKEPSTYQGITAIAGAIGVTVQPDLYESIAALMLAIIGVIQTIKKEKPAPEAK